MSAVITGNGLGLFNSSLSQLNGFGGQGNGKVGSGGDRVYVNASTGNLVIQSQDDYLAALGLNVAMVRTYNSLGLVDGDNGDNWQTSLYRRLLNLPATGQTTPITRINGDGHQAVFTYDSVKGYWISADGAGAHDTLRLVGGQWIYEEGSTGVKETYDATGRLLNEKDRDGNTLTYSYTGSLLTQVSDATGQITYLDYSGNNLTQLRIVSDGVTAVRVRYSYDGSNRLSTVKVDLANPNDATADAAASTYTTTYTYDGSSTRVARISQSDGSQLQLTYIQISGSYRIQTATTVTGGSVNAVQTFDYDLTNRRTRVTDNAGRFADYFYDTQDRLTKVQTPEVSGVRSYTRYEYDADGNVSLAASGRVGGEAEERIVSYAYTNGNLLESRDSGGNTIRWTYTSANQVETQTVFATPDLDGAGSGQPGGGRTTRYIYDAEQHLRYVISPEGRVTHNGYNSNGTRSASIVYTKDYYTGGTYTESALSSWVTGGTVDRSQSERIDYLYDFRGQLTQAIRYGSIKANGTGNGTPQITYYVYGRAGELIQTISPRGASAAVAGDPHVTSYIYDGLGRVTASTDASGQATVALYNDATRTVTSTAPNGLVTTRVFNKVGALISQSQSASGTTLASSRYVYDERGLLLLEEGYNQSGNHTTATYRSNVYNDRGQKVGEIDPAGSFTEYAYNEHGQLIRRSRYDGIVPQSAFVDSSGNPIALTLDDITANGGLLAGASARTEYFIHDTAGRLSFTVADKDASTRTVQRIEYDGTGALLREIAFHPTRNTTDSLAYSSLKTWADSNASNSTNRKTRYFYSNDGLQIGRLNAEGYLTETVYDAAGRISGTVGYAGITPSTQRESGSFGTLKDGAGSQSEDQKAYYFYDAQSRKIGELDATGAFTYFNYDAAGNLTITRRYAATLTYDATKSAADYVNAAQALITSDVNTQGRRTEYAYNELNRVTSETQRIIRNSSGEYTTVTRTNYVYDAQTGLLIRKTTAADASSEARSQQYFYDALGRQAAGLDGEGTKAWDDAANQSAKDAIVTSRAVKHSYDFGGRRTTSTDANGNITYYYYDRANRLRYTVRQAYSSGGIVYGEVTEHRYNAFSEIETTVTYAQRISTVNLAGGLIELDSAFGSRINAVANNSNNRLIGTTYTRQGQADVSTDAMGFTVDRRYNSFGEVDQIIRDVGATPNASKRTDTYVYDKLGRLKTTTRGSGGVPIGETRSYDAFGRITAIQDGLTRVWSTTYDTVGRTVQTTDPSPFAGQTTLTGYDAFGRILSRTDKLGKTTLFEYNDVARTLKTTTPEGVVTTQTFNRHGEVVTVSLPNGSATETTSYAYDRDGRLKTTTVSNTSGNIITSRAYDQGGRLTTEINGRLIQTGYSYDASNRVLTRTVDPTGLNIATTYAYDAFGGMMTVTDARGIVTETLFDQNGRSTAVIVDTAGLKLATVYTHDAQDNRLTVKEGVQASGSSGSWDTSGVAARTTQYIYDQHGRLSQEIVDPGSGKLNITTKYWYDANNNLRVKQDANLKYWKYTYDELNRQIHTVNPLGDVSKNSYDAAGRLTSVTRYSGRIAAPTNNTSITPSAVTPTVDAAKDRVTTTVYDDDGRAIFQVDAERFVVATAYDTAGRVKATVAYSTALSDGTALTRTNIVDAIAVAGFAKPEFDRGTFCEYDRAGRLTKLTDAEGIAERYTYDGAGNRKTLTNKLGHVWNYVYDAANRLVEERAPLELMYAYSQSTGTGLSTLNVYKTTKFAYDALGNLNSRIEGYKASNSDTASFTTRRTTQYQYDARGLQTRVIHPTVSSYDGTTGATTTNASPTTQTWYDNLGNAIASKDLPGNYSYKSYDAAGRLVWEIDAERYVTKYAYDGLGNVTQLRRYNGKVSQTTLDSGGESLVSKEAEITSATVDSLTERTKALEAVAWAVSNAASLTTSGSRLIQTAFDAVGRKETVTEPAVYYYITDDVGGTRGATTASPKTKFTYDALGNVISEAKLTNPTTDAWFTTYYGYDRKGNQTHTLDALKYQTIRAYNAFGEITSQTEYAAAVTSTISGQPNFGSLTQPTTTVAANDAVGHDRKVEYAYDRLGRRTAEKQVNTRYYEQGTSAPIEKTTALTKTTVYDALGNVTATVDETGAITRMSYDKLGRVIGVQAPQRESSADNSQLSLRSINAQYAVDGSNLLVSWDSLQRWGGAKVKVTLTYEADYLEIVSIPEHGISFTLPSHGTFTKTLEVSAAQALSGMTLTLAHGASNVVVQNLDVDWYATDAASPVRIHDLDSAGYQPRIEVGPMPSAVSTVTFQYRTKGSTGAYSSLTTTRLTNSSFWTANFDGLAAGEYEFVLTARNSSGALVNLTSVGGTSSGTLSGSIVVNRPPGEPAWVRADGGSQSLTPLTTYQYDLFGNTLVERVYAKSTTLPSTTILPTADANDRLTYFRYDNLGRTLVTTDALAKTETRQYDLAGRVSRITRTQTDKVVTNSSGATTSTPLTQSEIYKYDRIGRQLEVAYTRSSAITSAATDRLTASYNAFGEQTRRGYNGTDYERYDYDAGGRLWQTNKDGVVKVYEYDLLGNTTAEAVLPGATIGSSTNVNSFTWIAQSAIGSQTGAIRTERVYDALGRLIKQRDPAWTQAQVSTREAPVALMAISGGVSVSYSSNPWYEEIDTYTFQEISASWPSIGDLGDFPVKMTVQYTMYGGTVQTRSQSYLTGAEAGATMQWTESGDRQIVSVGTVSVYVQRNGQWQLVRQTGANSSKVAVLIPQSGGTTLLGNQIYYKAQGASTYSSLTVGSLGTDSSGITIPSGLNGTYDFYYDVEETLPSGGTRTIRYSGLWLVSSGKLTSILDLSETVSPARNQTFDRWGNVISVSDARDASRKTLYRYDFRNQVTRVTQPSVDVWSATATSTISAPVTTQFYDGRGNLIAVTDPNNNQTRYYYDAAGQKSEERKPNGTRQTYGYDIFGDLVRERGGNGSVTERVYDKLGQLLQVKTGVGEYPVGQERVVTYEYDEAGNRIAEIKDPGAGHLNLRTQYRYDTRGNLVETRSPMSVYDGTLKTTYTYNGLGQKTGETTGGPSFTHLGGLSQTWRYDYFGNASGHTDASGSSFTYTYDTYGRLWAQTSSSVTQTVGSASPTYTVSTGGASLQYMYYVNGGIASIGEYNSAGALIAKTSYRYDAAGNRIAERYERGGVVVRTTELGYDALGRLERVRDQGSRVVYGYDAAGNRQRNYAVYSPTEGSANSVIQDYWYLYDTNNRIVLARGVKSGSSIVTGSQSIQVGYDNAGRRAWEKSAAESTYVVYTYNPEDQLITTARAVDSAGTSGNPSSIRSYDLAGRLIQYEDYGTSGLGQGKRRRLFYNDNDQLITQVSEKKSGSSWSLESQVYYSATNYGTAPNVTTLRADKGYYMAGGAPSQYRVIVENGSNDYTNTYVYDYIRLGGRYVEARQRATTTAPSYVSGTTRTDYNAYGHVIKVSKTSSSIASQEFIVDLDGRVLRQRTFTELQNQTANERRHDYVYANGNPIGAYGNVVGSDGQSQSGFDYNYQPVSDQYPPATPGTHVVQAGETLQSIALTYFGDAGLWYLIADANGLNSSSGLSPGLALRIPNEVTSFRNANDTFRPYNAGEIMGDNSPEPVFVPPPPPKQKCGGFAQILVIAVAVIVTAYTAGAAAQFAAGGWSAIGAAGTGGIAGTFSAGATALAGGGIAGAATGSFAATSAAGVLAAGVGGALGNIAGQLVAKGTDLTDGFSWRQVGVGALTAAATTGVGTGAMRGQEWLKISAVRGAISAVSSYGANVIMGEEARFSWGSIAAAAVSAQIGRVAGIGLDKLGASAFTSAFGQGLAAGSAYAGIEGRGKFNFVSIAIDSFGNALGNSIVGAFHASDAEKQVQAQADRRRAERLAAGGLSGNSAFDLAGRGPYSFAMDSTSSAFSEALSSDAGFRTYGIRDEALALAAAGAPVAVASSLRGEPQLDFGALDREIAGYVASANEATRIGVLADIKQGARGFLDDLSFAALSSDSPAIRFGGGVAYVGGSVLTELVPETGLELVPELGTAIGTLSKLAKGLRGVEQIGQVSRVADDLPISAVGDAYIAPPIVSDIYSPEFIGPVKFESFYRGDSTLRTDFLSSRAELGGVPEAQSILAGLDDSSFRIRAINHSYSSEGSVFLSVTRDPQVAEYFARGDGTGQLGYVTEFRVPSGNAATEFATYNRYSEFNQSINPAIGLREQEYLAPVRIDPRYIFAQYQVLPR